MKALIKKIPPIKKICDDRDECLQLLQDAQSELERLHGDFSRTKNDLEQALKQNEAMETDLQNERHLFEELHQKYNELNRNSIRYECDTSSGEFWENHYREGGTSGTGSYKKVAKFKSDTINNFIKEHSVESVIELGCGDGNVLSLLDSNDYTGVDVSAAIIDINRDYFIGDKSKCFYTSAERESFFNRKYDLSMSLDVIFHLLEDDVYEQYMEDLFSLSNKYVIIYSSNHEEFTKWMEYRHRKFMRYIVENVKGFELMKFLPNKYQHQIGRESETSQSDFYFFKRVNM